MLRRMAELPERERLAIHALFLQEYDADEAAKVLGLSRSGIYALVRRGLSRLAKLVECPTAQEEGNQ